MTTVAVCDFDHRGSPEVSVAEFGDETFDTIFVGSKKITARRKPTGISKRWSGSEKSIRVPNSSTAARCPWAATTRRTYATSRAADREGFRDRGRFRAREALLLESRLGRGQISPLRPKSSRLKLNSKLTSFPWGSIRPIKLGRLVGHPMAQGGDPCEQRHFI